MTMIAENNSDNDNDNDKGNGNDNDNDSGNNSDNGNDKDNDNDSGNNSDNDNDNDRDKRQIATTMTMTIHLTKERQNLDIGPEHSRVRKKEHKRQSRHQREMTKSQISP